MRTLTSIQSSTNVLTDLEFHLLASDQSTTWIFDRNDIVNMSGLNWEVSFGGGFGKPSNYNITLNTSMGFITSEFKNIVRGETFLKVYVNSDNFTPHVGRVRNIDRKAENPNLLTLRVYDRFLDNNPLFPVESLVDSYSVLHPDVLNVDMGYPVYYGKHIRPFFMTPIDCNLKSLIGPRNISSENHTTSLWYNSNLSKGSTPTSLHLIPMGENGDGWNQENSDNIYSNTWPFGIRDVSEADIRYWEQGDLWQYNTAFLETTDKTQGTLQFDPSSLIGTTDDIRNKQVRWNMKLLPGVKIDTTNRAQGYASYTADVSTTAFTFRLRTVMPNAFPSNLNFINLAGSSVTSQAFDINISSDSVHRNWMVNQGDGDSMEFTVFVTSDGQNVSTMKAVMKLSASLDSAEYKTYSVFGTQVNCSDIAISENPIHIFSNICSHGGVNFVASQASLSQFDTTSYAFQAYFDERQSIGRIGDEFGKTTGNYIWIGDSGFLNFKTYQESSTIQNSSLINLTITTSDILRNSLRILDNPLGTTVFETKKAKKIKIDYDYDFATNKYNNSLTADPSNNAFCESAGAAGISDEVTIRSKYILESDTASLYLRNVVRQSTQDESIIELSLPARFFEVEIADICKVQHPAIIGSESLYQIIFVDPDYFRGEVKLKLYEILNL